MGQRRLPTMPLLAAALAPSLVAGCTGSDMGMAFDGNGPIPPVSIGTGGGTYGSPPMDSGSSNALASSGYGGVPVATPPSPISSAGMGASPSYGSPATYEPALPPAPSVQPIGSSGRIDAAPLQAPPTPEPVRSEVPVQSEASQMPAPAPVAASDVRQETASPSSTETAPSVTPEPVRAAALSGTSEIQFLPLVGAPTDKANLLAQALAEEAARSGITIRPASESRGSARLKGYFSTFNEGDESVLVYVWDVLDANDERVHRIQGQERFPKVGDDPWVGIDRAVLDRVADRTLEEAGAYRATLG